MQAMSEAVRKLELLENIVRLRRAGRATPGNRDIAAVRSTLERQLGPTVSRRLAGRALGVSHAALGRWIKTGDVPVLYTAKGRTEVPVAALLELVEAIQVDRPDGARYVLAPVMARRRAAARDMQVRDPRGPGAGDPHDRARARSLVYHQAVSQRLGPPMVEEARHVLSRWCEEGRIDAGHAERWEQLLDRDLSEIRRAMVDEGQQAEDLRQNSPFAGVLSEPERARILSAIA